MQRTQTETLHCSLDHYTEPQCLENLLMCPLTACVIHSRKEASLSVDQRAQ